MPEAIKKIWNLVTWIVVALIVALALLLVGGRFIGISTYVVLSGSMEPVYHTGSLIYVKEIEDTRNIPDGTVITYMANEDTIVTHRVVTAVPDEDDPSLIRYRTKGDANDAEDGTMVHYKNILGTPVFSIPKLGYLANYIQNPPGSYMAICFGAVFILLLFLPELLAVFLENEDEEEEKPRKEKRAKREKKSEKEKAPKPARKLPRKKQAEDDFPYEALAAYKDAQPGLPLRRAEPEFYEEPEKYPEPDTYTETPEYEASQPVRTAVEDDWLAALLADVDLSDV